jgi:5'-3' exonuclease
LNTCPGWHFRWACGAKQPEKLPYYITPFDAHAFFLEQCLTGDSTDNIPGCGRKEEVMWGGKLTLRRKGIGPAAAVKLLKEGDSIGDKIGIVREAYKSRFKDEDWEAILLENARLLYMGQKPGKLFDWTWISKEDMLLEKELEDRPE